MSNKEMLHRNDGMAYAYKIAKEQGLDALEEEIRYRNATMLPSSVSKKEADRFVEETKMNCLDTILIMSMMVLRDEFEFGKKRLNRFKARFNKKADCLAGGSNVNWKDIQELLLEETGVETEIRNAKQIDGAGGEK